MIPNTLLAILSLSLLPSPYGRNPDFLSLPDLGTDLWIIPEVGEHLHGAGQQGEQRPCSRDGAKCDRMRPVNVPISKQTLLL